MQREIGSWRRRESSGRFAGARLRNERIFPILSTHIEEGARAESWGFVNAAPSGMINSAHGLNASIQCRFMRT
jgi:hypothetical protein